MLTVGSLFSGIGGIDLGFERAGMKTLWFCEIELFCQEVLAKHWPNVPCYSDITKLKGNDVEPVDILCGGFPCQDISLAGKGAGLTGARSGLWFEFARLVGELRPKYVVVENVPALRKRGLHQVLQSLHACGYDAEWDGLPACAFGAPHRRDRLWLIAYPHRTRPQRQRTERKLRASKEEVEVSRSPWWTNEPPVERVVYGFPGRVDRLTALGNASPPQIAQWIGERILGFEHA